jgi:hypothetical protein
VQHLLAVERLAKYGGPAGGLVAVLGRVLGGHHDDLDPRLGRRQDVSDLESRHPAETNVEDDAREPGVPARPQQRFAGREDHGVETGGAQKTRQCAPHAFVVVDDGDALLVLQGALRSAAPQRCGQARRCAHQLRPPLHVHFRMTCARWACRPLVI